MNAALDRILHRLLILRGGTSTAAGDLAWDVSFPADPDEEDGPDLSFPCRFTVDGGVVTDIHFDAQVDALAPAPAAAVADLHAELAAAIERERVTFAGFDALAAFLAAETGGEAQEGSIEIPAPTEDAESVFASVVPVAGEPWVSLSTAFVDDVDPDWLLEQNGNMTHIHFEAFEGSVSLACAFPLALLTGQRLLELIDDLASFRERLLEDLEDGDDEDEG